MTRPTRLQQLLSAGKSVFRFGRRQRRAMKAEAKAIPSEPLFVDYRNGVSIVYFPKQVAGQLLVCDAIIRSPELPQGHAKQDIAISMYEFVDYNMRQRFRKYHAGLMSNDCLRWESDNSPVTSEELLGEDLSQSNGPVKNPPQSRVETLDEHVGGMGRTR